MKLLRQLQMPLSKLTQQLAHALCPSNYANKTHIATAIANVPGIKIVFAHDLAKVHNYQHVKQAVSMETACFTCLRLP